MQNGHETGPDCGGGAKSGCAACADGKGCKTGTDCTSFSCNTTTDVCLAPTSSDTIQNGNETDVDCGSGGGGSNAENTHALPCATGKTCVGHADCVADGCNYNGICIAEPSCAQHSGGDTCGAGEIDETTNTAEANSAHESCCASLPLPAPLAATRLDKYEITAGRMREFVSRTGGDIATWWASYIKANPTSVAAGQIRSQDVQYLPSSDTDPYISTFKYNDQPVKEGSVVQEVGLHLGLYSHIGATVIFSDKPSDVPGLLRRRDRLVQLRPPDVLVDGDGPERHEPTPSSGGPRVLTQVQLDEKSLNCVTEHDARRLLRLGRGTPGLGGRAQRGLGTRRRIPGAKQPCLHGYAGRRPCRGACTPTYDSRNGDGTTLTTEHQRLDGATCRSNDGTDGSGLAVNLDSPRRQHHEQLESTFYPTHSVEPPLLLAVHSYQSEWGQMQVDEAYEIAAPGRFVNDKAPDPNTGAPGGPLDGWFDLAGNLIEATSSVTGTDSSDRDSLPTVYWNGGSFEGHAVGKNNFTENILTKYGKVGGRCAR